MMMNTEKGPWKNWRDLGSDVNWEDYHGLWGFRGLGRMFYVIRHTNMVDAVGERDVEQIGCDVHESQVYIVDLDSTPPDQIRSALESCGVSDDMPEDPTEHDWTMIECLVRHGAAAPMESFTHPWRANIARKQAREHVRELVENSEYRTAMLDRPVNLIGSTAREYAAGDMASGVWRGVAKGDKSCELMARLGVA